MTSHPSQRNPLRTLTMNRGNRGIRLAMSLIVLAGATTLLGGCYKRVVKDKAGTYSGEVYEGNLPDDTRGFWAESFETRRVITPSSGDSKK